MSIDSLRRIAGSFDHRQERIPWIGLCVNALWLPETTKKEVAISARYRSDGALMIG
jgi:hypothetical protein